MNTQTETLLQHMDEEWQEDWNGQAIRAELRRLHAELEAMTQCAKNHDESRTKYLLLNAELLEALKLAVEAAVEQYAKTGNGKVLDAAIRQIIANEALNKMAENARELGLDYEPVQQQEPVNKYCCHLCFNKSGQMFLDRMILCPECGNKRCPKATHHDLPCTKSNDLGQKGSIYDQPAQQQPVAWQWKSTMNFRKTPPPGAEPGVWRPVYSEKT